MTLSYFDLRAQDFPNLFKASTEMFQKQSGIVLKHKQSQHAKIDYEICTKKHHGASHRCFYVSPTYPDVKIPPLNELLDREKFPQHDEVRWKLLKWMVDEDKLKAHDLEKVPKNYLLDILVLVFMTSTGFISTIEADIILLTIKHVELNMIPDDIETPEFVNERAFRVAHLFTKMHMCVERSLEVTGLKKSMTVRNFDFNFELSLII